MVDVYEALTEAAKNHETVRIAYHGGSQPGAVREIVPLQVTHLEVRARDVATNIAKTFKLAKIEFADGEVDYSGEVVRTPPEPESLVAGVGPFVSELEGLGWFVQLSEDEASVHKYFKNGSPQKGAFAFILRQPENSTRQWYVFSKELVQSRSYGSLGKAVELFLEHARQFAPSR